MERFQVPSKIICIISLMNVAKKISLSFGIQAYTLYINYGRYIVDSYEWSAIPCIMSFVVEQ